MALTLGVCSILSAATINVSPGSGTIKSAVGKASTGDVLVLAGGEYKESSYSDIKYSMTIKAADGAHPIIKMGYGYLFRVRNDGTVFTLDGVTIDGNGTKNARSIRNYGSDGAITANQQYIVSNCTFQNMDRAFYLAANTSECTLSVDHCTFTDVTRAIYIGTYLDKTDTENYSDTRTDINVPDLTVTNSIFTRNNRALSVSGARRTTKRVTVKNNTFIACGAYEEDPSGEILTNDRTLYFSSVDGEDGIYEPIEKCEIDHCTFYACNNTRTVYCPAYDGTQITNCICYFTEYIPAGYAYAIYAPNSAVKNSIAYGAPIKADADAVMEAVSYQNPFFVDAEQNNFQLYKNSPAVGTATDGSNMGDPRWGVSQKELDVTTLPIADRFLKTPYSMSPTTSSVKIIWQMCDNIAKGVVKYGTDKNNLNLSATSTDGKYVEGEGFVHVVTLTGLQPFTTYYYQVGDEKAMLDQVNSTKTAPNTNTAFRIFTISDIHVNSKNNWQNMQDYICTLGCDLMMCNGDFVNNGAGRDWNIAYFQPGKPFLSQTPMMSSAGNHETGDPLTYRWPTFYDYFWQFNHGTSEDPIADPRGEAYFAYDYGNARIIAVNINGDLSSPDYAKGSKQYAWLENELQTATQPWILIFGHVGLTTSGSHGEWPPEYREDWRSLLESYVAKGKHIIYFCGDDHSFEHAFKDGVHYVRPGCGRNSNYAQKTFLDDAIYTLKYQQISCYSTLDMSADASTLTLTARDSASNIFYTYQFKQSGEIIEPKLQITAPLTDQTVADSVLITWNAVQADANATVDLYYTTSKNTTSGGTAFATGIPAALGHAWFNGRPVTPKTTYYLYAVLHSDTYTITAAIPAALTLIQDTEAPAAPTGLDGNIVNGKYILVWHNPNEPVDQEQPLLDNTKPNFGFEGQGDGGTATLSQDGDALKLDYTVTVPWGQGAAVWNLEQPTILTEYKTLQFALKGDGSDKPLRLSVRNQNYGKIDLWFDESVSLASTDWKTYSIDMTKMEAQDWWPNSDTKNRLNGVISIEFIVPAASPCAGTIEFKDIQLVGKVNMCKDFAFTSIRRSENGYPTSLTEGVEVYRGKASACRDESADATKLYYYAAFAVDDMGNVSAPATSAQWFSSNLNPSITEEVLVALPGLKAEAVMQGKKIRFNDRIVILSNGKMFNVLGVEL